jgi:hypothetical protein
MKREIHYHAIAELPKLAWPSIHRTGRRASRLFMTQPSNAAMSGWLKASGTAILSTVIFIAARISSAAGSESTSIGCIFSLLSTRGSVILLPPAAWYAKARATLCDSDLVEIPRSELARLAQAVCYSH